jgi:hypothetical protein
MFEIFADAIGRWVGLSDRRQCVAASGVAASTPSPEISQKEDGATPPQPSSAVLAAAIADA